ncbi:hypothetical protein PCASD_11357 [Puccinia coronata f. sp. avenae]|uniref:Uncharacterized protein n=1 Tax=Puccinia coronata f. sp. avenae TaxID=200324 RepID=A0A2N5UFS2_9BASI|nr:hypothetical protein PCASD_11357 [Puccinia coronata f. sp. avenae]
MPLRAARAALIHPRTVGDALREYVPLEVPLDTVVSSGVLTARKPKTVPPDPTYRLDQTSAVTNLVGPTTSSKQAQHQTPSRRTQSSPERRFETHLLNSLSRLHLRQMRFQSLIPLMMVALLATVFVDVNGTACPSCQIDMQREITVHKCTTIMQCKHTCGSTWNVPLDRCMPCQVIFPHEAPQCLRRHAEEKCIRCERANVPDEEADPR